MASAKFYIESFSSYEIVFDLFLSLPKGFCVDIGNDVQVLDVIHEIFYQGAYRCLNISKRDIVLDCGANVGLFTLYAAIYADNIVSVEPLLKNYKLLLDNLKTNGLESRVKPIRKAIFDRPCEKRLFCKDSGAYATLSAHLQLARWEKVQCTTIDLLENSTGAEFDVLKIDVEGAEIEALRGAIKTLSHVREIAVEYHSNELCNGCEKILNAYGFKVSQSVPQYTLRRLRGYALLNFRQIWNRCQPSILKTISLKTKKIRQRNMQCGILYARAR